MADLSQAVDVTTTSLFHSKHGLFSFQPAKFPFLFILKILGTRYPLLTLCSSHLDTVLYATIVAA